MSIDLHVTEIDSLGARRRVGSMQLNVPAGQRPVRKSAPSTYHRTIRHKDLTVTEIDGLFGIVTVKSWADRNEDSINDLLMQMGDATEKSLLSTEKFTLADYRAGNTASVKKTNAITAALDAGPQPKAPSPELMAIFDRMLTKAESKRDLVGAVKSIIFAPRAEAVTDDEELIDKALAKFGLATVLIVDGSVEYAGEVGKAATPTEDGDQFAVEVAAFRKSIDGARERDTSDEWLLDTLYKGVQMHPEELEVISCVVQTDPALKALCADGGMYSVFLKARHEMRDLASGRYRSVHDGHTITHKPEGMTLPTKHSGAIHPALRAALTGAPPGAPT